MEEMEWMVDYGSGAFNNTTLLDSEVNSTLSCAARSIQGPIYPPFPDAVITTMKVCQSILLFLAGFSAFFLSILLIILVAKYKKLQTLEFGIAVQIATISMVGSIIILTALANCIAGRWLYGEHICGVIGAVFIGMGAMRALLMLIFVVDRFLSVFVPFKYPKHRKVVVTMFCLFAWSALLVVATVMKILDCIAFLPSFWFCSIKFACSRRCEVVGDAHFSWSIPAFLIPVLLYTILFIKAKRAKKAMAVLSNEQAYDWKATITFFLLFTTAFLLTTPTVVTEFFIQIAYSKEQKSFVPFILLIISRSLLALLPVTDAIVILRNADVIETVKDLKERLVQRLCCSVQQ